MKLTWRKATGADVPLLAEWNHHLIQDEAHRNSMTVPELQERMRGWLSSEEYTAILFSTEKPVAHALFKQTDTLIHLRQFFVSRDHRRKGIGKTAVSFLREEIWPKNLRLTVEVLTSNHAGVSFWRSVGYRDYSLTLEVFPTAPSTGGPKT